MKDVSVFKVLPCPIVKHIRAGSWSRFIATLDNWFTVGMENRRWLAPECAGSRISVLLYCRTHH